METVKIKVSHCKEKNKSVRVIVTVYGWQDQQLLTVMREYLKNIDVKIQTLNQLCQDLNCKYELTQPKDTINAIIRSFSSDKTDQLTIFVCDEVEPCRDDGQTTPDWTNLATEDNVEWILSMRPAGRSPETINMKPPSDPSILDRKLLHGHRNSYPIRSVRKVHQHILLIILYITDRSSTGSTLTISRRTIYQLMMRRSCQQTSYRLVQHPCGMMHPRDIPSEPFLRKYLSLKKFPVSL